MNKKVRSEAVDALVAAVIKMNPGELLPVMATGATAEERAQADAMILAMMQASFDHRKRRLEVFEVIARSGGIVAMRWPEILQRLPLEDLAELRTLYDAFPPGLQSALEAMEAEPDPR